MALWPVDSGGQAAATSAVVATSASGATVTASATAHVKGAWVQLIASTTYDMDTVWLWTRVAFGSSGSDTSALLDIGVGASGSELVVLPNIAIGGLNLGGMGTFPLSIAAGSRISARMQSVVVSKAFILGMAGTGGGGWGRPAPGRRATTYGANTATSSGVVLDDPTANHTKGAWTEITAATTAPIRQLIPMISGPAGNAVWTASGVLVDVAAGAVGSEQVLCANLSGDTQATELVAPFRVAVPVDLPSGTRLTMRFQQSIGTSSGIDGCIMGID